MTKMKVKVPFFYTSMQKPNAKFISAMQQILNYYYFQIIVFKFGTLWLGRKLLKLEKFSVWFLQNTVSFISAIKIHDIKASWFENFEATASTVFQRHFWLFEPALTVTVTYLIDHLESNLLMQLKLFFYLVSLK